MAGAKLSAPVGLDPRVSDGKPVKNKASDVVLVRKMLMANGIGPLGESGKMDSGLLKAIRQYQVKIGFKYPDRVIDPGGKTVKSLRKKYKAEVKHQAEIKMIKVTYRGKDLLLTESDYAKLRAEVFKGLGGYTKTLIKNHKNSLEIYQEYLDTAMMKDGVLNAVSQAIIMTAGSVKLPSTTIVGRSIKASARLQNAMKSKDLATLDKALPEAEQAINALNAEVDRFLKDFIGSAQITVNVLEVTSAGCFAVVGVLAMPVLVVGTGMSVTGAAVASGASLSGLQSATNELAKTASGQSTSVWGSVQSVMIDGAIGALTGGLGQKIPLKFVDKMAKAVAPRIAAKIPFLSGKEVEKFVSNYLTGSGKDAIMGGITEAINILGKMMKSGKVPTEADFDAAVENILYSALMGGLVKNLGRFQKKWLYKNKEVLTGTIFPDRLAKLAKGKDIPKTMQVKLWGEVMNKVSDTALKAGYHEIYTGASGDENESKLIDMATKAMMKDKKLLSMIDRELLKALKKNGIDVK